MKTVDELTFDLHSKPKNDRVVVHVTTKDSTTGEITEEEFDIDYVNKKMSDYGKTKIHITIEI